MKYLSVCSGIEAATVAWHPLGWEPLAFSEIEPFPRKVLAHHYPAIPLHGDFTILKDQPWIKDADLLVGGTPCQAFSVAGLRQSLADDRGNLTLEFVRLANAIDDLRCAGDGCTIVWENVPGVLSVKDNAFGCFLAALVGNDAPLIPTGGKWTNAGMVIGPQRSAAWRVLDAQYFGVAQRRRRVFVVASARDGFDPAEVLFEREGVRRDIAPRREARQKLAPTVTSGPPFSRTGDDRVETEAFVYNGSHWDGDEYPHPTLNQSSKASGGVGASNQEIFSQRGAYLAPHRDVAGPITAGISKGLRGTEGIESNWAVPVSLYANQGSHGTSNNEEISVTIKADQKNAAAVAVGFGGDVARTLSARYDSSPCADRGRDVVASNMAVRRLTPRECERLQGFPDDYTAIPGAADGPRYKALGNSMAVPVMRWIGQRIQNHIDLR